MSRPRSDKRQALASFVSAGGTFTMGKVATMRVPEAKRPVDVYQAATTARADAPANVLQGCMRSWAR